MLGKWKNKNYYRVYLKEMSRGYYKLLQNWMNNSEGNGLAPKGGCSWLFRKIRKS